ncbi:MAG: hypothetical protein V8T87_04495 [Victivallales bacterium]
MNASSNHIAFANPKADELIEKIRLCFDPAERNRLYHEFHRLIHDEEPYLFLFAPHSLVAVNKRYNNRRVFRDGLKTNILWVERNRQLQVPGIENGRCTEEGMEPASPVLCDASPPAFLIHLSLPPVLVR